MAYVTAYTAARSAKSDEKKALASALNQFAPACCQWLSTRHCPCACAQGASRWGLTHRVTYYRHSNSILIAVGGDSPTVSPTTVHVPFQV